jgi:nitroreductase
MDVNEANLGRRSIREYTAQFVDDETIHRLIEAAVRAPSAVNQQPWIFTVIRDQGMLDQVSRLAKAHMLKTMPSGSQAGRFRAHLSDPDFHIFYRAPVLILISATG